MGRTAGTPNKITAAIREKLSNLIDSTVNSIDISSLTVDQRIKLIQIAAQYILPRLRTVEVKQQEQDPWEDIQINVLERKEGLTEETESEVWADNFEITNTYNYKTNYKA